MAIYLFLYNGVLWAWQWSDYAHLVPRNMCTKFPEDISFLLNLQLAQTDVHTDRQTDGQTVTRISTRLFILIIYICITLYLTRLVLGDINNR